MRHIDEFDRLSPLFIDNGFRLYAVGGTVRDLLLGLEVNDLDFATDATPEEMGKFLEGADLTFSKFGNVRLHHPFHADITTLRKEEEYDDSRHPSKVTFVKDPLLDYKRRDFTINAIYLDEQYNIIDYAGGLVDLQEKTIRFIGDPYKRVKEDPLRIIRGRRFAKEFGFTIEPATLKAMEEGEKLLKLLNPEKIKAEERKEKR